MHMLEYFEAEKLLRIYGLSPIRSKYVSSAQEAASFSDGDEIVLKVLSDKAVHKSKAGLVIAGLKGEDEITRGYEELARKGKGFAPFRLIAQDMAKKGTEIIIGGKIDGQFGSMIMVGLGGIYVEAFKDVSLRVCPITEYDAMQMLDDLRSRDIITGGGEYKNMIIDLLMKVSRMFGEAGLKELDLNPVIVRKGGYDIVDIRMVK